jgi:hypothetical protein
MEIKHINAHVLSSKFQKIYIYIDNNNDINIAQNLSSILTRANKTYILMSENILVRLVKLVLGSKDDQECSKLNLQLQINFFFFFEMCFAVLHDHMHDTICTHDHNQLALVLCTCA